MITENGVNQRMYKKSISHVSNDLVPNDSNHLNLRHKIFTLTLLKSKDSVW